MKNPYDTTKDIACLVADRIFMVIIRTSLEGSRSEWPADRRLMDYDFLQLLW